MPHVYVDGETYQIIPRMTEIISSLECEAKASLHPVHSGDTKVKSVSNYVALAGTLGHHRIENEIRTSYMDLPALPLELSPGDQELYNSLMENEDAIEWVNSYVNNAYNNFLDFVSDFNPLFLVPEVSMVYIHEEDGEIIPAKSCKGTVDLICELDPEYMSDKALSIIPLDKPATVVLDWKTGLAKLDSHQYQLEGYKWLLHVSGKWEELVENGTIMHPFATLKQQTGREYPVALCVRLGGKKSYMADAYRLDTGKFHEARNLFLEPEPIVRARHPKWGIREFREGYHCVFCPYRDNKCPIFNVRDVDYAEVLL